jgi:hypothetical protein
MADRTQAALGALRQMRSAPGYRALPATQRAEMDQHLRHLEAALDGGAPPVPPPRDAYAQLLGTPADLQRELDQGGPQGSNGAGNAQASPPAPAPPPPPPPPPPGTATIGERAAAALEAVNFTGFVSSLMTGTFQAIVDASTRQIRDYAALVASLSQTLEDFTDQNVTPNQVRDWLAERHPQDLQVVLPAPGKADSPKLLPRPAAEGSSPSWLGQYDLGGQELSADLTEGPLLDAGRTKVGGERMQTLATLVLMGINRVVVSEGDITAKLQFHASARETTKAEMEAQQGAIAAQSASSGGTTAMMVSTLKANAQADASIKADLMGQVRIVFRSDVLPLERFADSAAIQLINRHARWQKEPAPGAQPAAPQPAAAPAPAAPQPAAAGPGGGGK